MTWGEARLAALQRMFANESVTLVEDDGNRDYLRAMPAAANEGLQMLSTVGCTIRRRFQIEFAREAGEGPVSEGPAPGKLTLPVAQVLYFITLSDECPDFRAILPAEVYQLKDGQYARTDDWELEGDDILKLDGGEARIVTLWYAAKPTVLTAATPDSDELGLREDAAVLLPLYMASQLYKEDDIGLATQYRNEFEDGLAKLQATARADGGASFNRVKNTSGWW